MLARPLLFFRLLSRCLPPPCHDNKDDDDAMADAAMADAAMADDASSNNRGLGLQRVKS